MKTFSVRGILAENATEFLVIICLERYCYTSLRGVLSNLALGTKENIRTQTDASGHKVQDVTGAWVKLHEFRNEQSSANTIRVTMPMR
jgi:hypothetical protein